MCYIAVFLPSSSFFVRAHRLHSHPYHTPLFNHTQPERLQAVEAAQREGAALKEELARSREVRLALLKKWHEARIAYDEVCVCMCACVSDCILSDGPPPCLSTRPHAFTYVHIYAHTQVQLQLLEAQGRINIAIRELNDAQRLQLPTRPPSARDGGEEDPRTALEEDVRWMRDQ